MNEPTNEVRSYWIAYLRNRGRTWLSKSEYAVLDSVLDWYNEAAGERDELRDELATLKAQRDALLAALEALKHGDGCFCEAAFSPPGCHPSHGKECQNACAAIAKATKGTAE